MYMLIKMTIGELPWKNVNDKSEVCAMKKHARTLEGRAELFSKCPVQYQAILDHFDKLEVRRILSLHGHSIAVPQRAQLQVHLPSAPVGHAQDRRKGGRPLRLGDNRLGQIGDVRLNMHRERPMHKFMRSPPCAACD